jgi:hypothetical protein
MATQITINSITSGTSPYDIWVCDTCYGTCQYINTINASTLPYSFNLPVTYETYPTYVVKIIDSNGCIYCDTLSSYKQFENEDIVQFMDGIFYEFE